MFSENFTEEFQMIFKKSFYSKKNLFLIHFLKKKFKKFFLYKTIDYTWKNEKKRMPIN